jgi:hypothetical protein
MATSKQLRDDPKWVCAACVGDEFLQALIRNLPAGECSYCDSVEEPRIELEDLAYKVEAAFESHYERTASEPDAFEYAMQRDSEFNYEWEREGDPVLDVISSALGCDEPLAIEVLEILRDKNDYYDYGDAYDGECEFAHDSYYSLKASSSGEWDSRWYRLEYALKHESRLFNLEVLELLQSAFANLDKAHSYYSGFAIVNAGPGTELTELYRAREFQSSESLKKALEKPVEELGPPPGRVAKANRMNSSGISVFYGAKESGSALAEVRPVVGSNVVVARFSIIRPIQLLDLRALESINCSGSIFDPYYAAELERHGFLRTLSRRLVLPVMPNEQDHAYLITQAVADYLASLRSSNIDGIVFPSVQDGVGENVVLFHKASMVEPLDPLVAGEIHAQVEGCDYETGEVYPFYALNLHQASPNDASDPMQWANDDALEWSTYVATQRKAALKLNLGSIEVHAIKAVEVKTEVQTVSVRIGTMRKQEGSRHPFEEF